MVELCRQIVHYPQNVDIETAKSQSRMVLRDQGVEVRNDAEFKPIDSKLLYNYSSRPDSKYNPVGYVDQGTPRVFSTAPTFMNPTYVPSEYVSDYQRFGQAQQQSRSLSEQRLEVNKPFSPRLMVTGVNGTVHQEYPGEGDSYIKELNVSNARGGPMKRPFEMIEQTKGAPHQFSGQVGNRIINNYDDYGQNMVMMHEGGNQQRYGNFNIDSMDWKIQK